MVKENELLIKILGDADDFNAEIKAIGRNIDKLEDGLEKVSKTSTVAFAALATSVGLVTNEFAKFEKALVGVGKTTDLSGEELSKFGKSIQDLAKDVPIAANELLGIAQAAGQLGVKGADNLLNFTETIAKLGVASDLSGEEAATALTRILTVTGEGVKNIDKFASVIVALGNNFAATESEITRVSTEVARSTSVFGLSSEQVAALSTTIRALGIQAQLGGSATGKAFRQIDEAIRQGGSALDDLSRLTGLTGDQLERTFKTDALQVFKLFIEGLGRVQKRGGNVAAELANFKLKGDEINKVLPVLAQRSEVLGRALNIAGKEVQNATALNTEAEKAFSTLSSEVDKTKNTIQNALVNLGEKFAPEIKSLALSIRSAAERFSELDKETLTSIASLVKVGVKITGVIAVLATLALGLVKAVKLFGKISIAIKASRIALSAFIGSATFGLGTIISFLPEIIDGFKAVNKVLSSSGPSKQIDIINKKIEKLIQERKKLTRAVEEGAASDEKASKERLKFLDMSISKNLALKDKIQQTINVSDNDTIQARLREINRELDGNIERREKLLLKVLIANAKAKIVDKSELFGLDRRIEKNKKLKAELEKRITVIKKEEIAVKKTAAAEIKAQEKIQVEVKKATGLKVDNLEKVEDLTESIEKQDFDRFINNEVEKQKATEKRLKEEDKLRKENSKAAAAEAAAAEEDTKLKLGGVTSFLSSGIQGMATGAVSAIGNIVAPGFGQAFGQAFELLSQDSEQFINTIDKLFSTKFLQNVSKNIAILAERTPEIVEQVAEGVAEGVPKIIQALGRALLDPDLYIGAIRGLLVGIFNGLGDLLSGVTIDSEEFESKIQAVNDKIAALNEERNAILKAQDEDARAQRTKNLEDAVNDQEQILSEANKSVLNAEKALQDELTRQKKAGLESRIKTLKDEGDKTVATLKENVKKANAEFEKARAETLSLENDLERLRIEQREEVEQEKLDKVEEAVDAEKSLLDFANSELETLESEAAEARNKLRFETDAAERAALETQLADLENQIAVSRANQLTAQEEFNAAKLAADKEFGVEAAKTIAEQIEATEAALIAAQAKEEEARQSRILAEQNVADAIKQIEKNIQAAREISAGEAIGLRKRTEEEIVADLATARDAAIEAEKEAEKNKNIALLDLAINRANNAIREKQREYNELARIQAEIDALEAERVQVAVDAGEATGEQKPEPGGVLDSIGGFFSDTGTSISDFFSDIDFGFLGNEGPSFQQGGFVDKGARRFKAPSNMGDNRIVSAKVNEAFISEPQTASNSDLLEAIGTGAGRIQVEQQKVGVDITISGDDAADLITAKQIEAERLGISEAG